MNNYYDNILIEYVEDRKINYTVISNISYYIENLSKLFLFIGGRINFSNLNNNKFVKSDQRNISLDAADFIKKLIEEKMCSKYDAIIYIGDNLTENGYEFCVVMKGIKPDCNHLMRTTTSTLASGLLIKDSPLFDK